MKIWPSALIEALPVAEKNALLLRTVGGDGAHVRAELLRRLRRDANTPTVAADRTRTVAELLTAADARRKDREPLAAERKAHEQARQEREVAIAYGKRLEALALREEPAWQQVHTLIEARKPAQYDEAVRLLKDLQAVGVRNARSDAFDQRVRQLRAQHLQKVSLLQRLDRLGL
jgi:hypothetical protein